jgi:phosphoenolpyruvate carboxylase
MEDLLGGLDIPDVINLVRAFSAYFYLANVAEQTHRVGDVALTRRATHHRATVDRVLQADSIRIWWAVVERLELRPVFTAHPTEATRRTLLTKLGHVADLLDDRLDPRATTRTGRASIDGRRADRPDLADRRAARRAARPHRRGAVRGVLPQSAVLGCPARPRRGDRPQARSAAPRPDGPGPPSGSGRGWAATGTATRRSPRA